MREVVRTSSLSVAMAAKLSLEGAGIEAVLGEEMVSGAYGIPFRVLILHDEDLGEARRVLADEAGGREGDFGDGDGGDGGGE